MSIDLTTTVTLNGERVTVTAAEDINDNGVINNQETISVADGTNTYTLSTLDGGTGNAYSITVDLSASDVTQTPVVHSAVVSTVKQLSRSVVISGTGKTNTSRRATEIVRTVATVGDGITNSSRVASHNRDTAFRSDGEITVSRGTFTRPRDVTTTGNGVTETGRTGKSSTRVTDVDGDGTVSATRVTANPRHVLVAGDGDTNTTRTSTTARNTTTVAPDGNTVTLIDLQEVFPDERALDVQWDYEFDPRGFATEWLTSQSEIPKRDRGGFGVNLYGSLVHEIDIWIQYQDGDEVVTSEKQTMRDTSQAVVFDGDPRFSDNGQYRVFIRGLRKEDVVNQVDVGSVHDNL